MIHTPFPDVPGHVFQTKFCGARPGKDARRRCASQTYLSAVDNLGLVEQLEAEGFTLSGRSIAEEVLRFVGEHNVSRIIVGKPGSSLWRSIFSGSPVDHLVRASREIDVHVMAGEPGGPEGPEKTAYVLRPKGTHLHLSDYGTGFLFLILATVLCFLMFPYIQLSNIARLQERKAAAIHGLTRQLVGTRGIEEVFKVAVRYISEFFDCGVVAMLPDDKGKLNTAAGDPSSVLQQDILIEITVARSAFDTGRMTGWGTEISSTTEILCVPLQAANYRLGILALKPEDPGRFVLPEQLQLLESLAKQVALALEVERVTASGLPHCVSGAVSSER